MVFKIQKQKDKFSSKNKLNVLVNLNATLCHVFIQDKNDIPPLINIMSNSSKDENQRANTHMVMVMMEPIEHQRDLQRGSNSLRNTKILSQHHLFYIPLHSFI